MDKPVEKAGKNDEAMMDSRVGSLTLGSLRAIAFKPPAICFNRYITQELSDVPFSEEPDIVGPASFSSAFRSGSGRVFVLVTL